MVTLPPWFVSNNFGTCSYHSVFCPIVLLFPCICWNVVVHTLYHVFLCNVLLPVLGILLLCGLLSRQIVGKVCTCCLSLCSIFLSHNILFVAPGLVLPLFIIIIIIIIIVVVVSPFISIPWCTVLLHNLTAAQLIREFPAFYETRMFITVIKTARPWTLSWAKSTHYTPSQPTS